jgi:long-chain acyl-CoA synthetase
MGNTRGLEVELRDCLSSQSKNLLEAMRAHGAPESSCLIDATTASTLTYSQVLQEVQERARSFEAGRPRLAFLVASNSVDTVLTYLSLIQAGHTICLWSDSADQQAMRAAIDLYTPHFVVGVTALPETHYTFTSIPRTLPVAIRRDETGVEIHSDTAILLTTSGSTGSSKLVRLSHRNIVANAYSIRQYLGISPSERAITMLPLSYSYGLSVLHSHLISGASIVLNQEPVVKREFWQAFKTHSCTSLVGVPYTHQTLLKMRVYRTPPPSLRYVTQAGGRLEPTVSQEIHEQLSQHGIPFFVMYGQTEATARMSFLPPEELPARLGSIGRAIPGGELSVVDDSGKALPPRQVGQILYRGPNVMLGYAEGPADLARGDELAGQLLTGDLGYCDEDGFLFLTGRMKRIAKLLGRRISLDEIEAFLAEWCPTAVIDRGDKVRCYFEDHNRHHTEAMHRLLSSKLDVPGDLLEFHSIQKLPRTPNGKLDYQQLEAL